MVVLLRAHLPLTDKEIPPPIRILQKDSAHSTPCVRQARSAFAQLADVSFTRAGRSRHISKEGRRLLCLARRGSVIFLNRLSLFLKLLGTRTSRTPKLLKALALLFRMAFTRAVLIGLHANRGTLNFDRAGFASEFHSLASSS